MSADAALAWYTKMRTPLISGWRNADEIWLCSELPSQVVYASNEWIAQVVGMGQALPKTGALALPTEEISCFPALDEGCVIYFENPLDMGIARVKTDGLGDPSEIEEDADDGALYRQVSLGQVQGVVFSTRFGLKSHGRGPYIPMPGIMSVSEGGHMITVTIVNSPVMAQNAFVTQPMEFGMVYDMAKQTRADRLLWAMLEALSMPALTTLGSLSSMTGPQRRRWQRSKLPPLRVLSLTPGDAGSAPVGPPGAVSWSHRWTVRGHWRNQACGPKMANRRPKWIKSFVKGPAHLPLDVRPTVYVRDEGQ